MLLDYIEENQLPVEASVVNNSIMYYDLSTIDRIFNMNHVLVDDYNTSSMLRCLLEFNHVDLDRAILMIKYLDSYFEITKDDYFISHIWIWKELFDYFFDNYPQMFTEINRYNMLKRYIEDKDDYTRFKYLLSKLLPLNKLYMTNLVTVGTYKNIPTLSRITNSRL
jgi:hypothetical protein